MVQKEANLETVIRISIRPAPSSTQSPRGNEEDSLVSALLDLAIEAPLGLSAVQEELYSTPMCVPSYKLHNPRNKM